MRGFLLDTNVISEFSRPRPAAAVVRFVGAQPADATFITDMVLAELEFGIETVTDQAKSKLLKLWLERDVRDIFLGRILVTTEKSLLCWRQLLEVARKKRITFSEPDTLLAAVALSYDLVVATRNWKDFERVGTPTLDPWKGQYRNGSGAPPVSVDLADPALLYAIGRA